MTPDGDGDEEVWVFGFGSLIHTPGFEYDARVEGFIRGWRRVWWQGSTDHRGTPAAPGRTVTLARDERATTVGTRALCYATLSSSSTLSAPHSVAASGMPGNTPAALVCAQWGAAFRLAGPPAHRQATLAYLEWREKQYDLRATVDVYARDSSAAPLKALSYIATADSGANPNYLGPAPLEAIAAQIAGSRGPSGANWEYLAKLAQAMRGMGVEDEELFELERLVMARVRLVEGRQ
jgi:cation transport regulator ChaC